jgi:hypothetical protein
VRKYRSDIGTVIAVALAVFMILTVFSQTSFATVQVTGTSNVNINEISAPLTVNLTPNATEYKGATFAWYPGNGTLQGNTYNFSGLLRIHVNWDVANTNYFLNILRIYDTGNLTGSFNLTLIHTAKQANEELGSQETSALSVYMKHGYQSSSDLGTLIENDTLTGPFPLYHLPAVSYYIGFYYTEPPDINNSVGQYLNFTFSMTFEL